MDIIGGDFNLITSFQDKGGGRRSISEEDKIFKGFIDNNNLFNFNTNNGTHTWNNRKGKAAQIASKLDYFLISEHIMLQNNEINATILPAAGSDH